MDVSNHFFFNDKVEFFYAVLVDASSGFHPAGELCQQGAPSFYPPSSTGFLQLFSNSCSASFCCMTGRETFLSARLEPKMSEEFS